MCVAGNGRASSCSVTAPPFPWFYVLRVAVGLGPLVKRFEPLGKKRYINAQFFLVIMVMVMLRIIKMMLMMMIMMMMKMMMTRMMIMTIINRYM